MRADKSGVLIKYTIRNVSDKPIRFFSVVVQNSSGSNENSIPMARSNGLLLPNHTMESAKEGSDYDVVPMTREVQERLKPSNEMKTLYILLVEQVVFADGSVYNDSKTFDALFGYFQEGCCK